MCIWCPECPRVWVRNEGGKIKHSLLSYVKSHITNGPIFFNTKETVLATVPQDVATVSCVTTGTGKWEHGHFRAH